MKTTFLFSLIIGTLFFLQSCETGREASYGYYGGESSRRTERGISDQPAEAIVETEMDINGSSELRKPDPKKIIYNAYISLTVKKVDTISKRIEAISERYNGYATEVGTDRVVIRVEAIFLDSALAAIGKLGRVDRKSVSGEDVTSEYFDLQIRMENAEKARTRYLELLAKAENVQAALLVEKELERLNNEIDLVKGRMKNINLLSAYSTITVNLKEKVKLGPLGLVTVGLYRGIKWLFVRG